MDGNDKRDERNEGIMKKDDEMESKRDKRGQEK